MPKLHGTGMSFHISWWTNPPDSFLPTLTVVLHPYTPIYSFVVHNKADPLGWCQVEKGGVCPTTALFQTTVWTWN